MAAGAQVDPYASIAKPVQSADPYASLAKPAQPTTQPGNAFTSGHPLDTLKANYHEMLNPQPTGSTMQDVGGQVGRGVAETMIKPAVDAGKSFAADPIGSIGSGFMRLMPTPENMVKNIKMVGDAGMAVPRMMGEAAEDVRQNGPMAVPHQIGRATGMILPAAVGGEAAEGLLGAVGRGSEYVGEGAINNAVGATPKMMKYGANPARGMVDSGVATVIPRTLTKAGMAGRIAPALESSGQAVGDAVRSSPFRAPLGDIAKSIENPIDEARGVIEGPGGANRSPAPLDDLRESMTRRAPGAAHPVYGDGAGEPFNASEAMTRLSKPGRLALPAPAEETLLHSSPDIEGTPSRPSIFTQPTRPMRLGLPSESGRIPMTSLDGFEDQLPSATSSVRLREFGGPTTGMGPADYIGQYPGERGGLGQSQGVLRRPSVYPESSEPSGMADLRHPEASANDLWRTIQNVDRNTRFNPDPEVEGLNEIRRSVRGGLRDNLETAVPGLKPLSQRYSDLVTADDALGRTSGQGNSLGRIMHTAAFPAEISGGTALVKGGRLMQAAAPASKAALFFGTTPKKKDDQ